MAKSKIDNIDNIANNSALDMSGAIIGNDLARIEALVRDGFELDTTRMIPFNEPPLITAIEYDKPEVVALLAKLSADVNVRTRANTNALAHGIGLGRRDCVKALINAGADLNAKGPDGRHPLHYAMGREPSSPGMLLLLLQSGSSQKAFRSSCGKSILDHCFEFGLSAQALQVLSHAQNGDFELKDYQRSLKSMQKRLKKLADGKAEAGDRWVIRVIEIERNLSAFVNAALARQAMDEVLGAPLGNGSPAISLPQKLFSWVRKKMTL